MLWRFTLAVATVCAGGMCMGVGADVMSRLIAPRDYGVKLCGREFIRAVIFTCGGSRWRRSTDGDLDLLQWSSLSDVTAEEKGNIWPRHSEPTDSHTPLRLPSSSSSSSLSLADLLALRGASADLQQLLGGSDRAQVDALLGSLEGDPATSDQHSKKKRNFSLGVAGMCCSQGCTKNDIGRLC